MTELPEVIGVIYPLPKKIVDRLNESRNIFVKFLPHIPTKKSRVRLEEGNKLYIYQSGTKKKIVVESVISKIEFLLIEDVFKRYENCTVATRGELNKYVEGRENKKLMVIHMKNIKKYNIPLKINVPITMAGRYITADNKHELFHLAEKY